MQFFANLLPLSARKTFWSRRHPISGERTGKRRETARRKIHPASGGQRRDAATTTAKKSDLVGEFNFPIASARLSFVRRAASSTIAAEDLLCRLNWKTMSRTAPR